MEFSYIIFSSLLFFFLHQTFAVSTKKSYIVYLGSHSFGSKPSTYDSQLATKSHYDMLESVLESKLVAKDSIIYSYNRFINGFAAELDEKEAMALAKHSNVVSVFENMERELHTTRSWNFLGVESDEGIPPNSIWNAARFGEDTIIGNLDTGVWPESKSFNDEGYGPVPSRWRGACEGGINFNCNRKLIGARYFNQGFIRRKGFVNNSLNTTRDHGGHGSHTLSTAGGNFVAGVNIFGHGNGTAKGGSPKARLAAYKVCWPSSSTTNGGCFDADILAAFEAAISDGVDVLSVSLGGNDQEFSRNPISIGAFHAIQQGIIVVCSGGNTGPDPMTVSNLSPWVITVAASYLDREFTNYVLLGNKKHYKGGSLSSRELPKGRGKFYPLMNAIEAKAANASDNLAKICAYGSLDPSKAKGKIIVCDVGYKSRITKGFEVLRVGGVAMIIVNDEEDGNHIYIDLHVLPASYLNYEDGLSIAQYINSTKTPMAFITHVKTELGIQPSPTMAVFSSRGPNPITDSMIKPDITAPGGSIIAAFTEDATATKSPFDTRRVPFNVQSGTSMACPHIAGVVGLLKTLFPTWSPAAIKSAIMTTANTIDNTMHPILDYTTEKLANPFDYGAGHVDPNNAIDPGLVYDTTIDDYLNFLCAWGYNDTQLKKFSNKPFLCAKSFSITDLNYPSISVPKLTIDAPVTINRRVKNVGSPGTYVAHVKVPKRVVVMVEPNTLEFNNVGEEKGFKVVFRYIGPKGQRRGRYVFGTLVWSDGKHFVRSPIAIKLE